jgi:hypothetical protein
MSDHFAAFAVGAAWSFCGSSKSSRAAAEDDRRLSKRSCHRNERAFGRIVLE